MSSRSTLQFEESLELHGDTLFPLSQEQHYYYFITIIIVTGLHLHSIIICAEKIFLCTLASPRKHLFSIMSVYLQQPSQGTSGIIEMHTSFVFHPQTNDSILLPFLFLQDPLFQLCYHLILKTQLILLFFCDQLKFFSIPSNLIAFLLLLRRYIIHSPIILKYDKQHLSAFIA